MSRRAFRKSDLGIAEKIRFPLEKSDYRVKLETYRRSRFVVSAIIEKLMVVSPEIAR